MVKHPHGCGSHLGNFSVNQNRGEEERLERSVTSRYFLLPVVSLCSFWSRHSLVDLLEIHMAETCIFPFKFFLRGKSAF